MNILKSIIIYLVSFNMLFANVAVVNAENMSVIDISQTNNFQNPTESKTSSSNAAKLANSASKTTDGEVNSKSQAEADSEGIKRLGKGYRSSALELESYIAVAMMILMGLIAMSLIKMCVNLTIDIGLAAAGAALFIWSVIELGGTDSDWHLEVEGDVIPCERMEKDKNGLPKDPKAYVACNKQKAALEALLAQVNESIDKVDAAEQKATWAAIAFVAAGAAAAFQREKNDVGMEECKASIAALNDYASTPIGQENLNKYPNPSLNQCLSGRGAISTSNSSDDSISDKKSTSNEDSASSNSELMAWFWNTPLGKWWSSSKTTDKDSASAQEIAQAMNDIYYKQLVFLEKQERKKEVSVKHAEWLRNIAVSITNKMKEQCAASQDDPYVADMIATCEKWQVSYLDSIVQCKPKEIDIKNIPGLPGSGGIFSYIGMYNKKDEPKNIWSNILEKIKKQLTIIKELNAIEPTIGYFGLAGGIILGIQKKSIEFVDNLLSSTVKRGILWGVFAALAFYCTRLLRDGKSTLVETKQQIEYLLAKFNARTYESTAIRPANSPVQSLSRAPMLRAANDYEVKKQEMENCLTGKFNENNKCLSIQEVMQKENVGNPLGDLGNNVMSSLSTLTSSLTDGNLSQAAIEAGNNLQNMAGAINRKKLEAENSINKREKEQGLPITDFRQEEVKLLDSLSKIDSSLSGLKGSSRMSNSNVVNNNSNSVSNRTTASGPADIYVDDESGVGLSTLKRDAASILGLGSEDTSTEDIIEKIEKSNVKLKDTSIHAKNNESIFMIISKRYFNSAIYKSIFNPLMKRDISSEDSKKPIAD